MNNQNNQNNVTTTAFGPVEAQVSAPAGPVDEGVKGLVLFDIRKRITPKTPGYLRVVLMAASFRTVLPAYRTRIAALAGNLRAIATGKEALTAAEVNEMIEVIQVFVLYPADPAAAREAILELSCDELVDVINQIAQTLT